MKNQNAVIVANIHTDWGRVVFKILRAGHLWAGLSVHHIRASTGIVSRSNFDVAK